MKSISIDRMLVSGAIALAVMGMTFAGPALAESKFSDPALLSETLLLDDGAELDRAILDLADDLVDARFKYDAAEDFLTDADELVLEIKSDNSQIFQDISNAEGLVGTRTTELGRVDGDLQAAKLHFEVLVGSDERADQELIIEGLEIDFDTADGLLNDAKNELLDLKTVNSGAIDALADAETAAGLAKTAFDNAKGELDGVLGQMAAAQQTYDTEAGKVETLITALGPEQIFALNRSLNNWLKNKVGIDIDAADLEGAVHYNRLQINALTKALESKAKFRYLAELTGNEKFLAKATGSEAKFRAKIERFDGRFAAKDAAAVAAKSAAKRAAQGAAKGAAKVAAKVAAKGAAKIAAQGAVKGAAKSTAKGAAKAAAKKAAKNNAKNAARGKKS